MSSRNSKIEPLEVQGILQSSASTAAKPSPVEHIPSSPAPSVDSSSRSTFHSHGRAMSIISPSTDTAGVLSRSNRFSLSFPIQPSNSTSPVRSAQSPVREAPSVVPESLALLTAPTDNNFLTAIAAQERRVLELKEELGRAQAELVKLKKQWGQHEAQKKRDDALSLTKLQPLVTSPPAADREEDGDGSSAWMRQEMERRKALLSGNRSSNRTVFSGSRHTRTLSLLSPVHKEPAETVELQQSARPPRLDSLSEVVQPSKKTEEPNQKVPRLVRAATTSDLSVDGAETVQADTDPTASDIDKEMLLKTGKKMATDLRDGLYTFWEDLRQAAVGEEATKILPPQRQPSTQNLRSAKKQSSRGSLRPSSRGSSTASKTSTDTKRPSPARPKHTKSATVSLSSGPALSDPSFWTDHGILIDSKATPVKSKKSMSAARHSKTFSKVSSVASSDNEAWDTWDETSPHGSRASSAVSESATLPSTVSGATSPRTSTDVPKRGDSQPSGTSTDSRKKDPIPWPALSNLGPKSLRRTASHLMAEWERSLTPSPSKEYQEQDGFLGLGAEAAASAVSADRKRD